MSDNSHPEITIQLLNSSHDTENFSCGDSSLDDWLAKRALKNQKLAATRTFVATPDKAQTAIGYYGLSMSQIIRNDAPKKTQRNMPESIPVVLLGRLAIDKNWQGKGLGRYLMRHMIRTCLAASASVAARMIVTQPIDDNAHNFYVAVGFEPLRNQERMLAIDLKKVAEFLEG